MESGVHLPLTWPLLTWLRTDPVWQRQALGTRAGLHWRAGMGSLNAGLSSKQDAQLALSDPVLVLGMWRSGTTAMHELLVAATGLPCPRTWHCMNAPMFRSLGKGASTRSAARPMDGLPVDADSPQEDEFALLSLGVDSAYRAFLQPNRLPELHHTLDAGYWVHDPSWLVPFQAFLRNVSAAEGQLASPLVLKSPNHSFRLPALLRAFPKLKVVWMLREPGDVLHSNRKMWRDMMRRYAGQVGDIEQLDAFLLLALERVADLIDSHLLALPKDQLAVCRQEDLFEHPEAEVARICAALSIPTRGGGMAQALARVRQGRVERYPAPPLRHPALQRLSLVQERLLRHQDSLS